MDGIISEFEENVEEWKYALHERAVRQRGASRQVREGNGKAYTVDKKRPRYLPITSAAI
jgi:hypothetical protein